MARTGMFVPRWLERLLGRIPFPSSPAARRARSFVVLGVLTVGGALALRATTVERLALWSRGRVSALAILPADAVMLQHRMGGILALPQVATRLAGVASPVLVYLVPTHYVMQGMIADTGPEWRLYEHHQTVAMIADWILHPFRHLEGGHVMEHGGMAMPAQGGTLAGGRVRRLIFLAVGDPATHPDRASLFALDATRTPLFFADIDVHTLSVIDVQVLGPGTGWGRVPTPMF